MNTHPEARRDALAGNERVRWVDAPTSVFRLTRDKSIPAFASDENRRAPSPIRLDCVEPACILSTLGFTQAPEPPIRSQRESRRTQSKPARVIPNPKNLFHSAQREVPSDLSAPKKARPKSQTSPFQSGAQTFIPGKSSDRSIRTVPPARPAAP